MVVFDYGRCKIRHHEQMPGCVSVLQDRFGKPLDVTRSKSDNEEGLAFMWAPAGIIPNSQPLAEPSEDGRTYLPLMGSLVPDLEVQPLEELQCIEVMHLCFLDGLLIFCVCNRIWWVLHAYFLEGC